MQYHVQSGEAIVMQEASSEREAAEVVVQNSLGGLGEVVMVRKNLSSSPVYFLTELLFGLRVVR